MLVDVVVVIVVVFAAAPAAAAPTVYFMALIFSISYSAGKAFCLRCKFKVFFLRRPFASFFLLSPCLQQNFKCIMSTQITVAASLARKGDPQNLVCAVALFH